MNDRIDHLNDTAAVEILRTIARKWVEQKGVEAFVVMDNVRRKFGSRYDSLPTWLFAKPGSASKELVVLSKLALEAILNGEDSQAKGWVEDEIEDLKQGKLEMGDPITLAIVGTTIIGVILAARVKEIGNIKFYEGVPEETVEIVKHATSIPFP